MPTGKDAERQFRASAEEFGYCIRIPDSTFAVARKGVYGLASQKSPADFIWFIKKPRKHVRTLLVEVKAVAGNSIPFARLQEHQRQSLLEFDNLCDTTFGYIAVNCYDPQDVRHCNRLFMVPVKVWTELEDTIGRKSLPIGSMERHPLITGCPRIKGSKWDMSVLVQRL